MNFGASELKVVLDECCGVVEGARLKNIYDEGARGWIFKLYSQGQTLFLHLGAQPRFSRLHLQPARSSTAEGPGDFCRALRSHLEGALLEGIRQVNGDRIAELSFSTAAGRIQLVQELFGAHPEILLLDDEQKIICALSLVAGARSRHERGAVYEFPPSPAEAAVPEMSGWLELGGDGEFPVSFQVAERMAAAESEALFLEKKKNLAGALAREQTRLQKIVGKLDAELAALEGFERIKEFGELLKGSYGSLRRGQAEIELVDYFSPGQEPVRIELDPRLAPEENIERYFKRYRKAKRAGPSIEARRGEVGARVKKLAQLGEEVLEAGDEEVLDRVSQEAAGYLRAKKRSRKSSKVDGISGPRSFVSSEGFTILVGRNARQNDQLSLRTAHGNDIFLHVSGRPGAHVIIRTIPGKTVPRDTLLEASQLALYYSITKRSGAVFVDGAAAEVDYTPAKLVSKPRGAPPGLVMLSSHKTLRIRLDRDIFERIRAGS
tara:strand:- start:1759 stop:3234 length:1476 start_codon:yes stop_codon:yes gene_type:complete